MYKKIIVPLDGSKLSEQVLPFVRLLVDSLGAEAELLQAISSAALSPKSVTNYLKKNAEAYLPAGSRISYQVELGGAAEIIVDRAKADPACLIAMATHGLSGIRRWLLGSVAAKVAQTATNPLLLVRPGADASARAEIDTVFVPLDGSVLAEKVLPHVIALAKAMKLEVHLLRVYTLPSEAYVVADGVVATGPSVFRDKLKGESEAYLEGKVDRLRAEGLDRLVATAIEGDAASEIIDLARRTPKNLIVMSTHGRSGAGRWLLGSVAERVVQHSQDPVLLIRAA